MNRKLLELFKNIYDKQSDLSMMTDSELFGEYSNSEVHTIDIVGSLKDVNGVMISNELNLTRGAVSKIMAKLNKKNLIESYQNKGNKKEIYYKLTEDGRTIYDAHKKAHNDWEERELKFFEQVEMEKKKIAKEFLEDYDNYLNKLIKERS